MPVLRRPCPGPGFCLTVLGLLLVAVHAPGQDLQRIPRAPMAPRVGTFGPAEQATDFGERARFWSEEAIRFDDNVAYAEGRTRIEFEGTILEADRMVIDFISEDITAEGNVVFRAGEEIILAERGRFNLTRSEGVAYGVEGQSGDIFFRAVHDEEEHGPAFRQLSEQESVFRGTHFTTSTFPVPFYHIASQEVILHKNQRIYFRNPVLYVRGWPVFWFPFYTRDLVEGSPWTTEVGYHSRLGAYFRLGYRYNHRVRVPKWEEPEETEEQSDGILDTELHLMSQRGIGIGAHYRYRFDYRNHIGDVRVYGIRDQDRDRELRDQDGDETTRWIYRHRHNSFIRWRYVFQLDINQASDPDLYYDILDVFEPDRAWRTGRLFERRMRAALTYRDSDWIARVMVDQRDRLGRDRYTDFSNPFDDDLDFDPQPDFELGERFRDDGISGDRFGTVSENASFRWSTRLLNLGTTPLFYRFEANAFDSLDSGFNTLSDRDDARVRGVDFWGGVTHNLRLGPRTTWTNTLGAGAAVYERSRSDLIRRRDFERAQPVPVEDLPLDEEGNPFYPPGMGIPFAVPGTDPPVEDGTIRIDGLRFRDHETIALGDSPTELGVDDYESTYLFTEYRSRLNHRFTEFLDGFVQYRVRQGTSENLGNFYEDTGRQRSFQDIHDFYTDIHYLEGGLNYFLRYPNLTASLLARQNLKSRSDTAPNEQLRFVGLGLGYINDTREFELASGIGYQERQLRDRHDPNTFDQSSIGGHVRAAYFPQHARYWAELVLAGSRKLEEDPVARDIRAERRFDENDTEVVISPIVGRQFGPKYRVQLEAQYNTRFEDFERFGVTVLRDLHDAELGLFAGMRNRFFRTRRDDRDETQTLTPGDSEYEYDFRATLQFKIDRDAPGLGQRSIVTLRDVRQDARYVR